MKSAYDWDFESEPEPRLNRRRNYIPRGRMVGGTGSMNSMLYVRGNRADYDAWPGLGAPGWSFDEVLPFFKRSEDNERGEDEFHAVGVLLRVSDARSVHPLLSAWVEAAKQAGHPTSADFNGAEQEGVGIYQVTHRDGLRCSPAGAFLEPALPRENLRLLHRRWRSDSFGMAHGRLASRSTPWVSGGTSMPSERSSCPRAPTSRHTCSCFPGWDRLTSCARPAWSRLSISRELAATSMTTRVASRPTDDHTTSFRWRHVR